VAPDLVTSMTIPLSVDASIVADGAHESDDRMAREVRHGTDAMRISAASANPTHGLVCSAAGKRRIGGDPSALRS
jgi:hypothetical protein